MKPKLLEMPLLKLIKKKKNPIISAVLTPGVTPEDIEKLKQSAPQERKVDIQKNNNENIKKTEETPDFRG